MTLLASLMLCSTISFSQIWEIGYGTMTFVDASRGNRVIDANIYYPADATGWNVPLGSPFDKKYPVIVFGHDEGTAFNEYQYVWDKWVPKGFVVVMPLTEMGVVMDVEEFAKDIAFITAQFRVLRYDPASFWFKRHNSKSSATGHGKGAASAVVAMQHDIQITTLMTLTANETAPGTIAAASMVTQPSVVVAGGEDCVSPLATVQEAIFNNLDTDCKTLINFTTVPRCIFAQNASACTASQVTCGGSNPYSWQSVTTEVTWYLVSFMRFYMKSNVDALVRFEWKLQQKKKDLVYIMLCNTSAPRIGWNPEDSNREMDDDDFAVFNVKAYPNPVSQGEETRLVVESDMDSKAELIITGLTGQVVASYPIQLDSFENEFSIPTGNLAKGHYLLTVTAPGFKTSKPLLVY